MRNSFISSFRPASKWRVLSLVVLGLGWLVFIGSGHLLAGRVPRIVEERIIRLGQGKIVSAEKFIHGRLLEFLLLLTLAEFWFAAHLFFSKIMRKRPAAPIIPGWAFHSILAFVCLNLWLLAAGKTILFWGFMWDGQETQNLTRFHLKRLLTREEHLRPCAILVGNSQTRAQIDEELLNIQLSSQLRTTELHYPGTRAYDLYVMQPIIDFNRPDYVICYATEAYFYNGSTSEVIPNFYRPSGLADIIRRHTYRFVPARRVLNGVVGWLLPLFRTREVLVQRLFGPAIGQLNQKRHDLALNSDLSVRGRQFAQDFALNEESEFQKNAFEDYVIRCGKARTQMIVLCGQLNPLVSDHFASPIRADMLRFLKNLQSKYSHLTLIDDLPQQGPEDYEDLTHVTKGTQARFTRYLADFLRTQHAPRQN